MITITASSQTVKENIDKLAKDKATRDKADKADVLMRKKIILDSAQIQPAPAKVVSKTPAAVSKAKHNKKKYKKKRKISSK